MCHLRVTTERRRDLQALSGVEQALAGNVSGDGLFVAIEGLLNTSEILLEFCTRDSSGGQWQ